MMWRYNVDMAQFPIAVQNIPPRPRLRSAPRQQMLTKCLITLIYNDDMAQFPIAVRNIPLSV
jgi:hypothetical protein